VSHLTPFHILMELTDCRKAKKPVPVIIYFQFPSDVHYARLGSKGKLICGV
jgi:hypothetical protein